MMTRLRSVTLRLCGAWVGEMSSSMRDGICVCVEVVVAVVVVVVLVTLMVVVEVVVLMIVVGV